MSTDDAADVSDAEAERVRRVTAAHLRRRAEQDLRWAEQDEQAAVRLRLDQRVDEAMARARTALPGDIGAALAAVFDAMKPYRAVDGHLSIRAVGRSCPEVQALADTILALRLVPDEITAAMDRGDLGGGCGNTTCICRTQVGPPCEEWEGGLIGEQPLPFCLRCGWAEHLHTTPKRRRAMTPDEMITSLSEHGGDAGSDFNDGDLMGWFGWHVTDGILTVTYEPADGNGDPGPKQTASWRLVPEAGR